MRLYHYIGPAHLLENAATAVTGETIHSATHAAEWLRRHSTDTGPDGLTPATFIIEAGGALRLAPRRSEHVHCAQGRPVLSAGETFFSVAGSKPVAERITNQSTGYAPEPASWPAVAPDHEARPAGSSWKPGSVSGLRLSCF